MKKNCEECLALSILIDNKLIDVNAVIDDKPDIISNDKCVEVTSAIKSQVLNQLNFGLLPKKEKFTRPQNYECGSCTFLSKCKAEFNDGDIPRCEMCADIHNWFDLTFFNIPIGSAYYMGREHPSIVPYFFDHYGNADEIIDAIKRKEQKSLQYKRRDVDLFLYYDKDISKMKPITSNVFSNIYIYCLYSGSLYKNWEIIKEYSNMEFLLQCHNKKCDEFEN